MVLMVERLSNIMLIIQMHVLQHHQSLGYFHLDFQRHCLIKAKYTSSRNSSFVTLRCKISSNRCGICVEFRCPIYFCTVSKLFFTYLLIIFKCFLSEPVTAFFVNGLCIVSFEILTFFQQYLPCFRTIVLLPTPLDPLNHQISQQQTHFSIVFNF